MALTCPRCGTEIPAEALYCPYCSLAKPKRRSTGPKNGKTGGLDRTQTKPSITLGRPSNEHNKPRGRSSAHRGKSPRKIRLPILSGAALAAIISVGFYIFVVPLVYSHRADPKVVLSALDKLRRMPSNDPQVTLDARLMRELESSRRAGNLVSYHGWTVRPINGTKTKVILAFSYEEVGGAHQSAEWIADLKNNTFTPQTELASTISAPIDQETTRGVASKAY